MWNELAALDFLDEHVEGWPLDLVQDIEPQPQPYLPSSRLTFYTHDLDSSAELLEKADAIWSQREPSRVSVSLSTSDDSSPPTHVYATCPTPFGLPAPMGLASG